MNHTEEKEEKKEKFVTQDDFIRLLSGGFEDEDDEIKIDWAKYIKRLWNGRKTIIWTSVVFAILGAAVALLTPHKYQSTITLAPESTKGTSGSSLSGIASMLGMGSFNMGGGADAYNVTMYPDIVASTPFITSLFDVRVVDPELEIDTTLVGYLTRKKGFSFINTQESDKEEELEKDILDIDIFQLTKPQAAIVKLLSKAITADVDKKTGITTITTTFDNPYIAAIVADSVCTRLRSFIVTYRTQKSREDLAYYQKLLDESQENYIRLMTEYAEYQDRNHRLIVNSEKAEGIRLQNELQIATQIYTQMKQQTEITKGKVQEEKPIFAVIEPASVPLYPSDSRKTKVIIFTFLGFFFSSLWVLFGKTSIAYFRELRKSA